MAFSVVIATFLQIAVAAQALSFLQAGMKRSHMDLSPELSPFNPGAVHLEDFEAATQNNPVKFFIYDVAKFEPRFDGEEVSNCERKGADYMFIKNLRNSEHRVYDSSEAEVMVVPCLFETYRRCTTTNHAEKPPEAFIQQRRRDFNPDDHPEDFESIPWVKPWDDKTQSCLDSVMATKTFSAKNGTDHVWIVADWAINFGRASESELFKQMSIGRIEVVNEKAAETSNRPMAVGQSRCSFVVPYASDVAYDEKWKQVPTYAEWRQRSKTIFFRFEDRSYVLFCKGDPCEGAVDASPLRKKSLELAESFGDAALVKMERVPKDQLMDELHDAKFCLVMRGDTPSSHGFYDALAANCVPIVVSDEWDEVAGPFASGKDGTLQGGLKHHEYTLRVSEQKFMDDLPAVAHRIHEVMADDGRMRELFENMQKHRSALLWSMPGNSVSDFALQSARRCVNIK